MNFAAQAGSVFGAGLLSSLSPCVYPMIPITLSFLGSESMGKKSGNVLLFALGQSVTFAALGLVATQLGEVLGFTSESRTVNLVVALVLLAFGVLSLRNELPSLLRRWNQGAHQVDRKYVGRLGAFAIGVSAALIASPCTSPILGAVLASVARGETVRGMILMMIYGLGATCLFVILGLGLVRARRLPRAGAWMTVAHKLGSVLIFGAAGYYFWRVLA